MNKIISAALALWALAAFAAPAAAQQPPRQLNPFSSAADGVRFAIQAGCLPFLAEGGSIHERVHRSSRGGEFDGRPADRLFGRGDVQVQENPRGGCDVIARRVDADAMRVAVLSAMAEWGSPSTAIQDSGPGSRDSNGDFRQESHCFMLGDKVGGFVMSTSHERRRPALLLSLFIDDGHCAAIAASGQSFEQFIAERMAERTAAFITRFGEVARACRAIGAGGSADEVAQALGVELGAPQSLAESAELSREYGMSAFFGAQARVRYFRLKQADPRINLLVSEDGARCMALAISNDTDLEERLSRAVDADDPPRLAVASHPREVVSYILVASRESQ